MSAEHSQDAAAPSPSPSWGERLFRPRGLMIAAGFSVMAVLGPWLIDQIPNLPELPEYRLPLQRVQLEPAPPPLVPANFLEQVQRRAELPDELPLLDPELPAQLAQAFRSHPWVEEVVAVRNLYPAQVVVELKYRRPVALVQVADGFYVVDPQGVLLPPSDFAPTAAQKFVTVAGISTIPHGGAGRDWGDVAVRAAARLADFIGPRWEELGIAAIVAPPLRTAQPREEDLLFELQTTGGSTILWGRAPGVTYPGELTAQQKLARLDKYLAEFGGFDRPHGPYEIDIRHWQEISRRPLTPIRSDRVSRRPLSTRR